MKKIILWISILTMILGTAGVASATLINGGFENGDFTGWDDPDPPPPTGAVLGFFPPDPPDWAPLPFPPTDADLGQPSTPEVGDLFIPKEGAKFAALQTGEVTNPGGTDPKMVTDDGSEPTLTQTVNMQAGYTLSGYAAFFTQEPQYVRDAYGNILYSFNDSAYLKIFDSGGNPVPGPPLWESSTDSIIADVDGKDNHELYFDISELDLTDPENPIIVDGTYDLDPVGVDPDNASLFKAYVGGWSEWAYWEWTAPAFGYYTLTLGVINEDFYDNVTGLIEPVHSVAFLDNVVLTPEPATVLLLASGLGGLAGLRRRFKK